MRKDVLTDKKHQKLLTGAKLEGGMGGGVTHPPTPDFAGHRESLQGKIVEFDMRK